MDFQERVISAQGRPLIADAVSTLQVNLGYVCNMSCTHCHVEAGPGRQEIMERATAESVLSVLRDSRISALDITGGAPELNQNFRFLVEGARKLGCHVIVRGNLTVLSDPVFEHILDLFSEQDIEITASLPCYSERNVDSMRGKGAFIRSLDILRRLNSLGYGCGSAEKKLNLVYNPAGAFLPPSQEMLEHDYKRVLSREFGVAFDRLYTFVNMPIGRFGSQLEGAGKAAQYRDVLRISFNPAALAGLMCRSMVNVGWNGRLYDCDFNQVLGIPLSVGPRSIRDIDLRELDGREISVGEHCFGCTAGEGFT